MAKMERIRAVFCRNCVKTASIYRKTVSFRYGFRSVPALSLFCETGQQTHNDLYAYPVFRDGTYKEALAEFGFMLAADVQMRLV